MKMRQGFAAVRAVAVAMAIAMISGCGMNTMKTEQYALKSTMSDVMAAVSAREKSIDELAKTLKSDNLVDDESVKGWVEAKRELAGQREQLWTDDGNEMVLKVAASLRGMESAADRIANAGKMAVGKPSTGKQAAAKLNEQLARDAQASTSMHTAQTRYDVQVENYNKVISIAPVKWAATLMGERARVGLLTTGEEQKSAVVRELREPPRKQVVEAGKSAGISQSN